MTKAERILYKYFFIQFCKENFIDTLFIVANTNNIEGLFSVFCYAHAIYRNILLPDNSERQLFLHVNKNIWDTYDVNNLLI